MKLKMNSADSLLFQIDNQSNSFTSILYIHAAGYRDVHMGPEHMHSPNGLSLHPPCSSLLDAKSNRILSSQPHKIQSRYQILQFIHVFIIIIIMYKIMYDFWIKENYLQYCFQSIQLMCKVIHGLCSTYKKRVTVDKWFPYSLCIYLWPK